jgi:hypothetical protein
MIGCGALVVGCGRSTATADHVTPREDVPSVKASAASPGARTTVPGQGVPSAETAGAPRAGMAWVPAGILRAGTSLDKTPRIAEEELTGTEIAMGGYYIDLLPYPNEAGAIPTSNVTREDAAHLCEGKGKRLCSEFEWERACKGPENASYEYGDAYRVASCRTGVSIEESARRPSGERVTCKSGFGVMDMHGSVWEWTDSPWRRGSKSELGVLRGGNSKAGELVGRCANAIGRNVANKGATMGFRCCGGPRNASENELVVRPVTPLERSMKPKEAAADVVGLATKRWGSDGAGEFVPILTYTWHPVANEELIITSGCAHPPDAEAAKKGARCGLLVARSSSAGKAGGVALADVDSGHEFAEVVLFGDGRHLRMRGLDLQGIFVRELTYVYGRVEVGEMKRR